MYVVNRIGRSTLARKVWIFSAIRRITVGPNELRLVKVTKQGSHYTTELLTDKLTQAEVRELKRRHALDIDERAGRLRSDGAGGTREAPSARLCARLQQRHEGRAGDGRDARGALQRHRSALQLAGERRRSGQRDGGLSRRQTGRTGLDGRAEPVLREGAALSREADRGASGGLLAAGDGGGRRSGQSGGRSGALHATVGR
jgi:hypothetical protein